MNKLKRAKSQIWTRVFRNWYSRVTHSMTIGCGSKHGWMIVTLWYAQVDSLERKEKWINTRLSPNPDKNQRI